MRIHDVGIIGEPIIFVAMYLLCIQIRERQPPEKQHALQPNAA